MGLFTLQEQKILSRGAGDGWGEGTWYRPNCFKLE